MTARPFRTSRRTLLTGAAAGAVGLAMPRAALAKTPSNVIKARPLPAKLTPGSIYADAVESNRKYLLSLEPDRLLHNFRLHAGLKPKGEIYGGWESDTISGHTLGHYLSALSLMYAQTGDTECGRRVDAIVADLAECQRAHGDGYVAAFTRRNGDAIEPGKVIFAEIARGDIRAQPFDLNGAWSPLYNVHKTFAGLLDAHQHRGNEQALAVATGFAAYLDRVFAHLDDAQMQTMLDTEHGGLNESMAELYARTHDARWLALAERLYHKKVLDPLAAGRDELEGLHANTQIPKLIGLARLYELTGKAKYRKAAETFWHAVVEHHSYVIGGNSDREHFRRPDTISKYITEQTCESCNTYNMLKLTRHLYAWEPRAAYFDYYERAHLNHIMAQHNAETGMFAYMVPLMAGTHREWSKPTDDFWCCVGTGMESHSKHGDSAYWTDGETLYVNSTIPSAVTWQGAKLQLDSAAPFGFHVRLAFTLIKVPRTLTLAMRIPPWIHQLSVSINGNASDAQVDHGYAWLRRRWHPNDVIAFEGRTKLRAEPTRDDPRVFAVLDGAAVLATDLGPADKAPEPVDLTFSVDAGSETHVDDPDRLMAAMALGPLGSRVPQPFFRLVDRNTAIYFKGIPQQEWDAEQKRVADEAARMAALDARSVDIVKLGDEYDEKAHDLTSKISYPLSYRFRKGRDARDGGYFEFAMKVKPGPLSLQATYWGDERDKLFHISVDGTRIATETQDGTGPIRFIDRDYPIPPELTRGKRTITVRFEPEPRSRVTPVYGVRLLAAD